MPFLSIWYEQDFKADANFLMCSCLHGYGLDPTKNLKYAVVIGGLHNYWQCNFPMNPHVRLLDLWLVGRTVGPSVGCWVGLFVGWLVSREVTLLCFDRSTCLNLC